MNRKIGSTERSNRSDFGGSMDGGNVVEAFREAMRRAGLEQPAVIEPDGLLHRFYVEGDKRGSRNGWYLLHLDGRAAGAFGSWKTGLRSSWAADGRQMNNSERDAFTNMIAAARIQALAERRAEHESRAIEARREWEAAAPANTEHRYLIAKGVKPHNLRQAGDTLLVPLFDAFGMLWNIQRIQPTGRKRFRKGRSGGLFSPLGDLTDPTRLLVCEGWATGATLHTESGHPVLCAMNAGNLLPVAKVARIAWPHAELVICADNDCQTAGNPGLTAATAAANATGARLIVPEFPAGVSGSDFNDLAAIWRTARAA